MPKTKEEQIFVGVGEEIVELTGKDKEAFLEQRLQMLESQTLLEAEYKAKQDARESAIKKLADIAGLTKEELASIL